jgi:hypothetical protein
MPGNGPVRFGHSGGDRRVGASPCWHLARRPTSFVGRYKNTGREWQSNGEPERVEVYDFVGEAGKAIPYGVYDLAANTAWVSVGRDHDTPCLPYHLVCLSVTAAEVPAVAHRPGVGALQHRLGVPVSSLLGTPPSRAQWILVR